ncbi:glycosyltransferase family 4 protein [Arthrobacter subterraneus]|nr:glycosyltransferase family 1 protein [Arthrobacter subterraneus]
MRIAFVTEVWRPSINGVVTRLSVAVDGLLAAGHQVLIIAPDVGGGHGASPRQPGLTVRRVPSFRFRFIYGGQPWGLPMPRVDRYLKDFRPDLVHVVSPLMLGIAGVLAARLQRLPLVASFHTDVAAYAGSYHLGWLRPAIWWVTAQLHRQAALNLVTSEYAAQLLASHRIDRVQVWQRGVDLSLFQPARALKRTPDELPTALYVGRLADEKGLHRLAPLARSGCVRLLMVGDGPDRDRLQAEFAGTPTSFPGSRSGSALAETYAGADVFVFPSTTETLGLVILEALASGLPVVAADTPTGRELLQGNPAARLFPPDRPEQIAGLVAELLSGLSREELAQHARREAERWGWRAATEQLTGYYREVLDDAG